MATGPKREPAKSTRPEPATPAKSEAIDKIAWSKAVVLLNVVLIVVVAVAGFRYVQPDEAEDRAYSPDPVVADAPTSDVRTSEDPSDAAPSDDATASEEPQPTTPAPVAAPRPEVEATLRADFTKGDSWPVGAGFREIGRMAYSLGVVDGLMVHGAPEGPGTVSWLEKWAKVDVRRIGARVLFAPNHSGSAAITAWHTSVLETSGTQVPRTGLRLVAEPGAWRLVALDAKGAETVLTSGTWALTGRSASFDLVRKGGTAWVTDPTGAVTSVTDPRIGSLSGPWAGWELREAKAGQRPAALQEIWAG